VLLQHGNRLAEDFIERHGGSSTHGIAPRRTSTAAYHTRTSEGAPCRIAQGRYSIAAISRISFLMIASAKVS
jgi:hypothetical protein